MRTGHKSERTFGHKVLESHTTSKLVVQRTKKEKKKEEKKTQP